MLNQLVSLRKAPEAGSAMLYMRMVLSASSELPPRQVWRIRKASPLKIPSNLPYGPMLDQFLRIVQPAREGPVIHMSGYSAITPSRHMELAIRILLSASRADNS